MAHQPQLIAQLVADLFLAIDREDSPATFSAACALAARSGEPAALALARALLADHRQPRGTDVAPMIETAPLSVPCA